MNDGRPEQSPLFTGLRSESNSSWHGTRRRPGIARRAFTDNALSASPGMTLEVVHPARARARQMWRLTDSDIIAGMLWAGGLSVSGACRLILIPARASRT